MEAEYSEIALAGLARLFPDEVKREGVRLSIAWKLTRDPGFQARPCAVIANRPLRVGSLFAGFEIRILFEVTDRLRVYSIAAAQADWPTE